MAVSALTFYHWTLEGGLYCDHLGLPRLIAMDLSRPPNYHGGRSAFAARETLHMVMCDEVPANIQEAASGGQWGRWPRQTQGWVPRQEWQRRQGWQQ